MRIQEILTELFEPDKGYELTWDFSDRFGTVRATARDKKDLPIKIEFLSNRWLGRGLRFAYLSFSRGDQYNVTDEGDAVRIMTTVVNAIREYLIKYADVDYLIFTAREPSRIKLYRAMARKFDGFHGWHQTRQYPESLARKFKQLSIGGDEMFVFANQATAD